MSSLLGSTSNASTGNKAYGTLSNSFKGSLDGGAKASTMLQNLLGLGDTAAGNAGFEQFRNSSGYDFQMDQGSRAITGNAAARGLLQSGSTAKGLTQFGQGLGAQSFQQYLQNLMGLGTQANQSGSVLGSTGNFSKTSQGSGLFGLKSLVGG